jgi:hypothetical protein
LSEWVYGFVAEGAGVEPAKTNNQKPKWKPKQTPLQKLQKDAEEMKRKLWKRLRAVKAKIQKE